MRRIFLTTTCVAIVALGLGGCTADRGGFTPRGGGGNDSGVIDGGAPDGAVIDHCDGIDCENGGACIDQTDSFSCDCDGPWAPDASTGLCTVSIATCSDYDPCLNGGDCHDISPGNVECDCAGTGYEGDFCQIDRDECEEDPCRNGGVCINTSGDFSCDCEGTGYKGRLCGKDINECNEGTDTCDPVGTAECDNDPGDFECVCKDGYTGDDCELCDDGYVRIGEECVPEPD